mgnify:CR=1 FL=1
MALHIHADAVEKRKPGVAKRRVFGRDDVVAEVDACAAAGEERGAVVEVVLGADVAAVGEGHVIEKAAAIGFLRGLELVEESGEQLALRVGTPLPHADLGKLMPLFAGALFVVLLVFWLFDRGIPMNRPRPGWLVALAVVLVIVALAAMAWAFRVGHSGSEAVWKPIIANTTPAAG